MSAEIEIKKIVSALEKNRSPIIESEVSLASWKVSMLNIIHRVYGSDSIQEKELEKIEFKIHHSFIKDRPTTNNSDDCERRKNDFINSLIDDINSFGIPNRVSNKSDGINITLNQTQTQKIDFSLVIQAIQDELNGKQLKEVQGILDSSDDEGVKKSNLISKLKEFGTDVASNIVASILTNPAIYGA